MNILIFKTDISNRWHVNALGQIFNQLQGIKKYTVDVEDVDHVLRVESFAVPAPQIQMLLSQAGYYCEELTD